MVLNYILTKRYCLSRACAQVLVLVAEKMRVRQRKWEDVQKDVRKLQQASMVAKTLEYGLLLQPTNVRNEVKLLLAASTAIVRKIVKLSLTAQMRKCLHRI